MHSIVQSYFGYLESKNYLAIVQLFTSSGKVYTPFSSALKAAVFYKKWLIHFTVFKVKLLNISLNENQKKVVAHFIFEFTYKNGVKGSFEAIDIFEFSADAKKIENLREEIPNYNLVKDKIARILAKV
jgi:hypothetical protein